MKLPTSVDFKTRSMSSEEKMAPVQIVQAEQSPRRGVTGKHVLIAITVLLAVAIVVAGFVTAFFFLKQTTTEASDNLTKAFSMKLRNGKQTINEYIETNVQEKTTEIITRDTGRNSSTFYNDFKKGLSVFVSGQVPRCFVAPMNRSSAMEPDALQKYMENHPNADYDMTDAPRVEERMTAQNEPIEDTTFLGPKINALCQGKTVHWMYPESEKDGVSRQKRREYGVYRCHWHSCGCLHCVLIGVLTVAE